MITITGTEYHEIESADCKASNFECHFYADEDCRPYRPLCDPKAGASKNVIFVHPDNYHLYVAARLKGTE